MSQDKGASLVLRLRQRLGSFDLDIDLTLPAAEAGVTVLLGASGAGKTAVLNAVAGLTRPDWGHIALPSGRVMFDSAARLCLPPQKRRLGVIFQQPRLFPHLTVRQNLTYGRRFAAPGAVLPTWDDVVAMLGIGHLLHRRPLALSGGEAARVAIGRALLAGPEMILADEPLAALDTARRAEILPYFQRLRDVARVPMLYVTHSQAEMAQLASQVVALQGGRVVAFGTPAQVLGQGLAGMGGPAALLPARLAARHADGLLEYASAFGPLWVPAPPHGPAPAQSLLRIAAQDVTLALAPPGPISALNILPGTITQIQPQPDGAVLVTLAPGGARAGEGRAGGHAAAARLLARITQRSALALQLQTGQAVFGIVKSLALAPD